MTSKIELGVFSLFCAICAVVGGTTPALIEPIVPDDPASVIKEEDVVPVAPLPDTTEPESEPTPEPVTSPTTTPETTPSPEVTPTPTEQTEPQIISYMDYIDYYAGLCPSEQPKDSWAWPHGRFRAALGVQSAWPTYQHYVEAYWNEWHISPRVDIQTVSSFANMGFEDNGANRHSIVYIDWSTWTVFWESSNDSPSYSASWDATVAEMQSYLRELESRYRQLCPND